MSTSLTFCRLIELSLSELLALSQEKNIDKDLCYYHQVLVAYLREDKDTLRRLANSAQNNAHLTTLALLRLQIRENNIQTSIVEKLMKIASIEHDLEGEIYFVLGLAYEATEDHLVSQGFYKKAAQTLQSTGSPRKAIKALHNVVAAESRIYPDKKLVVDYHNIARRARKVKEFGLAGVAFLNISREYQLIGALEASLKYCNRALKLMENDMGVLHYYLTLAHRAHLLCQMGRQQEAELDYQIASISPYPEVKSALKVVDLVRAKISPDEINNGQLLPTWKERLQMTAEGPLGSLENRLIHFLSQSPRDKFEIIKYLYGENIDFELLENRLKVLINRVRKKRAGLILFENGKYRLSDEVYLTNFQVAE